MLAANHTVNSIGRKIDLLGYPVSDRFASLYRYHDEFVLIIRRDKAFGIGEKAAVRGLA